MSNFTVRTAEPTDWEIIADFNCRLALETEDKQLDVATVGAGVQALLADPAKGRYFVACDNNTVVGQLMHTLEWSDWRNGEIWWLQSVFVHPDFRRCGVFRLLHQHVHSLAANSPHVVGLRLYVEPQNHRAQDTYRSLGMDVPGYFVMEQWFK